MSSITPKDIIEFWCEAGPKKWWKKDDGFDAEISRRFGAVHKKAALGDIDHWSNEADGALALILILDQFSRNLYRNNPKAFALDAKCRTIVNQAMGSGLDRSMSQEIAEFCYLPLMHSENVSDQKRCLQEMLRLNKKGNVKAAEEHLAIIERFGRFPHRNSVLGRKTTAEEQSFLDGGGFSG